MFVIKSKPHEKSNHEYGIFMKKLAFLFFITSTIFFTSSLSAAYVIREKNVQTFEEQEYSKYCAKIKNLRSLFENNSFARLGPNPITFYNRTEKHFILETIVDPTGIEILNCLCTPFDGILFEVPQTKSIFVSLEKEIYLIEMYEATIFSSDPTQQKKYYLMMEPSEYNANYFCCLEKIVITSFQKNSNKIFQLYQKLYNPKKCLNPCLFCNSINTELQNQKSIIDIQNN